MTTFDAEGDPIDEDLDDASDYPPPYRDEKVHVMSEKCATCVFRPGNLMNLNPGRLKDMTDSVKETGVPFSCHQTLGYASNTYRDFYQGMALCAGAVESYDSPTIRLAQALNMIESVEPYPSSPLTDQPQDDV